MSGKKKKTVKQLPPETVRTVGALIESLERFPPETPIAMSNGLTVADVIWIRGYSGRVRAVDISESDED